MYLSVQIEARLSEVNKEYLNEFCSGQMQFLMDFCPAHCLLLKSLIELYGEELTSFCSLLLLAVMNGRDLIH